MTEQQKAGRIAIRTEGKNVVAYYALPDTMEGAIWLASVLKAACDVDERIFENFMSLARSIADSIFAERGIKVDWKEPEPAPDHERAGNS